MAKATMDMFLLSSIHIVILGALLLLNQCKSFVESSPSAHPNDTVTIRIVKERYAFVNFKAGLSDPKNILSLGKGDDCCKWKGVHCSSRNSHVVNLDLRGGGCNGSDYTQVLGGNISSSLLGLQHLQYLSLGCKPEMGSMGCKYQGSWVLSTS
jgi:hypothetical protein